jgi:type IV fimbrial biogenesis protein FimT
MNMRIQKGFTIIELMTAVALLAVMVVIGVPSFNSIINTNETAANSNAFLSALKVARTEATKRRQNIVVCASNNQSDCASNDWSDGWIIFEDTNDDGAVSAGPPAEPIIDTYDLSDGFAVSRAGGGANSDRITFFATGLSSSTVAQTFTVCKADTASGRMLTVERSGLVTGTNVNCP